MYIILLNGYVGCLKTTLSYLIAPALGLANVSTSVLGPFSSDREDPRFLALRDNRYRIASEVAAEYLRNGISVVLDGTYSLRRWRKEIYSLASKHGVEDVVAIKCTCSNLEMLGNRFCYRQQVTRAPDAQANQMKAYDESLVEFEPIDEDRLPNNGKISLIDFDSGTFSVTVRRACSDKVEKVTAVIESIIDGGLLSKPLFDAAIPPSTRAKQAEKGKICIALEGIAGSGKTTQCRQVGDKLRSLFPHSRILIEQEFSDSSLGTLLGQMALERRDFPLQIGEQPAPYLDSLLVLADRIESTSRLAASADWDMAIIDELKWSIVAHIVAHLPPDFARRARLQVYAAIETMLGNFPLLPGRELNILLECPPEIAIQRVESRVGSALEPEKLEYLKGLSEAYKSTAQLIPNIHVVDAAQEEHVVTRSILDILVPSIK